MSPLIAYSYLDMLGFDFELELEIDVTSFGEPYRYSPTAISPPDPPEFQITSMHMRVDRPNNVMGPWWEVKPDTAQFSCLETHPLVEAAVKLVVLCAGSSRYWRRRRRIY